MTNFCEFCSVKVAKNLNRCPLCGRFIEGEKTTDVPTAYPKVDMKRIFIVNKIRLAEGLLVIVAIVSLLFNLYTARSDFADIRQWWSVYVILSCFALYFGLLVPLANKGIHYKEIWSIAFVVVVYIMGVDALINLKLTFSLYYAIPIILMIGIIAVGIVSLCVSGDITGLLGFMIQIFAIDTIYLTVVGILFLCGIKFQYVPTFICAIVSASFFVFFFIFRGKEMRVAFRKLFRV